MRTLVCIPCYNCEKQITRVIDSIASEGHDEVYDFLIIDNISQDNTLKAVTDKISNLKNQNRYKILLNNENYGLGGSQKVAFNYATENEYDFVIILHGDDQARVQDISRLLSNSYQTKHSTLGSRFMFKSNRVGYQKTRTLGNIVLNIIFTLITFRITKDLGSGINVFSVNDLKKIKLDQLSNSFNFNVDLLLSFYKNKLPISFLPITWVETDQVSNAKNLSVALSMLKSLFFWRFSIPKEVQSKELKYKIINL